jgi:hypothetical protein
MVVKVKPVPQHAKQALRGDEGMHNPGARRWWLFNTTPHPDCSTRMGKYPVQMVHADRKYNCHQIYFALYFSKFESTLQCPANITDREQIFALWMNIKSL